MFSGKDFTPAQISEVHKDSPAYISGIKDGDLILSIDDKKVTSILDVSTFINTTSKKDIVVNVLRNDSEISYIVTPKIIKGNIRLKTGEVKLYILIPCKNHSFVFKKINRFHSMY